MFKRVNMSWPHPLVVLLCALALSKSACPPRSAKSLIDIGRSDVKGAIAYSLGVLALLGDYTQPAFASASAATRRVTLFVPGYKLGDPEYYSSVAEAYARTEFLFLNDTQLIEGPLEQSASALERAVRALSRQGCDEITLFGHSRGASVCALALLLLLSSTSPKSRLMLCLLDPVDDAERTCISRWAGAAATLKWPKVSVKMIATPYGGFSNYYRKKLDSSCAPAGRDAEALRAVLVSAPALDVEQWNYPDLGHLQLLDESVRDSPLYSVCPVNENEKSSALVQSQQAAARAVIKQWAQGG